MSDTKTYDKLLEDIEALNSEVVDCEDAIATLEQELDDLRVENGYCADRIADLENEIAALGKPWYVYVTDNIWNYLFVFLILGYVISESLK